MNDIFISYDRSDAAAAKVLAGHFAQEGWSVWWDRLIPAGHNFFRQVDSALDDSRCVVVVWSPRSVQSDWVVAEANEGLKRRALIPIVIEDAQPPVRFRIVQTIDLSYPRRLRDGLGLVSSAVRAILDFPPAGHAHADTELEDPDFVEALRYFRERQFTAALSSFRTLVRRYPQSSEARYFLVLCALSGRRPKLLRPERVEEIEVQLREALAAARGDTTHIRYLWAVLRYDCYTLNGLREPSPTAEELIAGGRPLERLRACELTSAIAAPGNPVWEAVAR